MLPQINRLKKNSEIKNVFKKGRGFKEGFLFLKIIKNNLERIRFGFIISQKVSKKATIRNKIKRRLSEIVRARFKKMKPGIDALLIAVPGLETKDFWEIETMINNLFKKGGLIK